jgi:hypothetical protein
VTSPKRMQIDQTLFQGPIPTWCTAALAAAYYTKPLSAVLIAVLSSRTPLRYPVKQPPKHFGVRGKRRFAFTVLALGALLFLWDTGALDPYIAPMSPQVRSEYSASSSSPLRGLPPLSEEASAASMEKLQDASRTGGRLHVIGSLDDNTYIKYTGATVFSDSIVIYREETVLGSKPDTYPFNGRKSGCITSDFAATIPASAGPDNIPIDRIYDYIPRSTYLMIESGMICPYRENIVIEVTTYGEYVGEGARFYHTNGFPCVTDRRRLSGL